MRSSISDGLEFPVGILSFMDVTQALVSFVIAITLLVLTPGLDTALVLRVSAQGGGRSAFMAALGVVSGCALWGFSAAIGLSAMFAASRTAYDLLRLVGAAYLIWVGARLLLSTFLHRDRGANGLKLEAGNAQRESHAPFVQGVLQNLLNPKLGVFYVTFLPQFIPQGVSPIKFTIVLALIHVGICLLWFIALIAATRRIACFLRQDHVVRAMDRVTAVVFLSFGLRLAFQSRLN